MIDSFLQIAPTKKTIIFDFDNTLFLLDLPWSIWHERIQALAEREGMRIETHGSLWSASINQAVKEKPNLVKEFRFVQDSFESNYLQGYEANQDLIKWIQTNNQHYTFHIWSAQSLQTIQEILLDNNLLSYFQKIICRDNLTYLKPDSEGFVLINQDSSSLSDFLMVGDSSNDKDAALNAGIDYCFVAVK